MGELQPNPRDGQSFDQIDMENLSHGPHGYVVDAKVIEAASVAIGTSAELVELSLVRAPAVPKRSWKSKARKTVISGGR